MKRVISARISLKNHFNRARTDITIASTKCRIPKRRRIHNFNVKHLVISLGLKQDIISFNIANSKQKLIKQSPSHLENFGESPRTNHSRDIAFERNTRLPHDPVIHPTIKRASAAIISSDLYGEWRTPRWSKSCRSGWYWRQPNRRRQAATCAAQPCGDPAGRCIFRSSVTPSREKRVEQVMPVAETHAFASQQPCETRTSSTRLAYYSHLFACPFCYSRCRIHFVSLRSLFPSPFLLLVVSSRIARG